MATNRKFIGEQTPGPREVPSKSMNSNPKFIGENTAGAINRMNPARAFLSGKVSAGLPVIDTPNGCVYHDDDPVGEFGIQGRPSTYYGTASRRKLFGGNRSGE